MKLFILFTICFSSVVLYAQDSADDKLAYRKTYFSLGTGPSTITGFSFLSELGVSHRRNTLGVKGDVHIQFWGTTGGRREHDVFFDVGLIYGRIIPKDKLYFEINAGPVFYGYFDEHLTTVSSFGSTHTAVRTREYAGFGFLLKTDIGKLGVKKVSVDYSGFLIINTQIPIIGVTANLNFRLAHKELPPKL